MEERIILLTPEIAKGFLSSIDDKQRKISAAHAAKLANDITDGRWSDAYSLVDVPLMLSRDGKLMNGQHRCKAVVIANKPIHVKVVYGVDDEMFEYMDNAKSRQVAQFVDSKYANNIVAVAAFAISVEMGMPLTASSERPRVGYTNSKYAVPASRSELLDYIKSNRDTLIFCAEQAQRVYRAFNSKGGGKSAIAKALWTILYTSEADTEGIISFVDEVVDTQPLSKAIAQGKAKAFRKIMNAQADKVSIRPKYWLGLILAMYDKYIENKGFTQDKSIDAAISRYDELVASRKAS